MSHQPNNSFAGTQVVALFELHGPGGPLKRGACVARSARRNRGSAWQDLGSPLPWLEVDALRKELQRGFERALAETKLPERPDYEAANRFLINARRETANQK